MNKPLFANRTEAGKALAQKLLPYRDRDDVLVLAVPRGGVPVAFEVSQALRAPIETVVVRRLGLPGREEFAMGAIASGGIEIRNKEIIDILSITSETVDKIRDEELHELERRERAYRGDVNWPRYKADIAILVDDGLATGYSMRVAIEAIRNLDTHKIIVAIPVAAADSLEAIASLVDETVCLATPTPFNNVSQWYEDFQQVSDEEVHHLIQLKWRP
ncbi:MAG TPA: phosphoribosyltransferase family protein [Cellvibrio sp.]|nr:phosphoribosyltransferase family protein [Cellvibrio sp.]